MGEVVQGWAMTRSCPICASNSRDIMFDYPLTSGVIQTIFCCNDCGIVYASVEKDADYAQESIYSLPGALGSGESPFDRQRLDGVAQKLESLGIPKYFRILDIGCAQGGLLTILRERKFSNLYGIDPSKFCVDATTKKGFEASIGYLGSRHTPKANLVILSHVLEHIEDVRGGVRSIPAPLAYIEVPDATRYKDFDIPFLDFNSEHINHFSLPILISVLESEGFQTIHAGQRTITLTSGRPCPAIWVLAERKLGLKESIEQYIVNSQQSLQQMNESISAQIGSATECILWGAGEYMTFIANLPIFQKVKIVQAVDHNPALHGKSACGIIVEETSKIRPNLPIVIATLVAVKAIERDIKAMDLTNPVATIA